MTDAELTVAAVRAKGWECVRLRAARQEARWPALADHGSNPARRSPTGFMRARMWAWRSVTSAPASPCLIPTTCRRAEMTRRVRPTVPAGSSRGLRQAALTYVEWMADMPAKLTWEGGDHRRNPTRAGRAASRLCRAPCISSGGTYRWIREDLDQIVRPIDPVTDPLPSLPPICEGVLEKAMRTAEQRFARPRSRNPARSSAPPGSSSRVPRAGRTAMTRAVITRSLFRDGGWACAVGDRSQQGGDRAPTRHLTADRPEVSAPLQSMPEMAPEAYSGLAGPHRQSGSSRIARPIRWRSSVTCSSRPAT